tara:strand:+ start:657 stop:965 length:309 start_codon:yes stop_codon:yes gene_type:complete
MNSYVTNLYPVHNDANPMQTIALGVTVTSFANNFDSRTNAVLFTLHNGSVYITFDGSTPSASNGHIINSPYVGWFNKNTIRQMKMLKHAGAGPEVAISQFTN